jgi:uncharacterized protein (UPF0335 family)
MIQTGRVPSNGKYRNMTSRIGFDTKIVRLGKMEPLECNEQKPLLDVCKQTIGMILIPQWPVQ